MEGTSYKPTKKRNLSDSVADSFFLTMPWCFVFNYKLIRMIMIIMIIILLTITHDIFRKFIQDYKHWISMHFISLWQTDSSNTLSVQLNNNIRLCFCITEFFS